MQNPSQGIPSGPQPMPVPVMGGQGPGIPSAFGMILPPRHYTGQDRQRRRRP